MSTFPLTIDDRGLYVLCGETGGRLEDISFKRVSFLSEDPKPICLGTPDVVWGIFCQTCGCTLLCSNPENYFCTELGSTTRNSRMNKTLKLDFSQIGHDVSVFAKFYSGSS